MEKSKKRVPLSFLGEDKQRVQGLRLLAANPDYDLEFYDESVRVEVNSKDADYVKRVIREKIGLSSITVCLISEETHNSAWIDWELKESDDKKNSIIAMALKRVEKATLPRLIQEKKLTFHAWDPEYLGKLITTA